MKCAFLRFTYGWVLFGWVVTLGCGSEDTASNANTVTLSRCSLTDASLTSSSGVTIESAVGGASQNTQCTVSNGEFLHQLSSRHYKDAFHIVCAPSGSSSHPRLSLWVEEAIVGTPFQASFPYGSATSTTTLQWVTDSGTLEQDSFEWDDGHTVYLRGVLYQKTDTSDGNIQVTGCAEGSFIAEGSKPAGDILVRFGFAVQRFGSER